jgi:hypothetical protein
MWGAKAAKTFQANGIGPQELCWRDPLIIAFLHQSVGRAIPAKPR